VRPEDGGDHLPVKLASARSSADTIAVATEIQAVVDGLRQSEREAIVNFIERCADKSGQPAKNVLENMASTIQALTDGEMEEFR
jgi:hypothetical protein